MRALLSHLEDKLAISYMGYYDNFLTEQLFLFSLEKNNMDFIRRSLKKGAFDKQIFKRVKVVDEILEQMK